MSRSELEDTKCGPGGRPWVGGRVLAAGLAAFVTGLVLSACSVVTHAPATTHAPPLVWPPPPEVARIAFCQVVVHPADLGIKIGGFTRVGHWLTGSEKGNEPMVRPFGLALDEQDNLCVTDTGANTVSYYDRSEKRWRRWAKVGSLRFGSPVAVAKRRGEFFVADSGLSSVVVFNESGKLLRQIKSHLERPAGLAILGDRLYVADSARHRIVVFDLSGNFQADLGKRGRGPGEFNFPTHVAADGQGRLLVTDSLNGRVQILSTDGTFCGEIGRIGDTPGHFSRPKGVAVDQLGHVYAIDAMLGSVQIFDASGHLLLSVGESGDRAGEFWLPNGIAISHDNQIFIADSYNRRLQIFKYVGPS